MIVLPKGPARRRALALGAIILVQVAAAAFFLADVLPEFYSDGDETLLHSAIEIAATLALIASVVVLGRELRRLLFRIEAMDRGLAVARGRMSDLTGEFFDRWGLTPSERDVAILMLKGLENDAIAAARGTAPGTVRAQTARIYAKAGVEGRAQLFAFFMEELMADS